MNVAADTGLPAETVDKWINRASAPSIGAFLALVSAYGPELLSAAYDRPPEWIDEAARAADAERTRAQIAALTERLTRLEVRP